ncbi:MAG: trigger factor [Alphaproteobacteria bacterium]|nr:trigger factor [Alphaproteobacteria bacterium]
MQVFEKLSDGLKREIQVVIPYEDFNCEINKHLSELKERVHVPGFRAGKVPISHLRRLYGPQVMKKALDSLLKETSRNAIESCCEKLAFQPQIDLSDSVQDLEMVIRDRIDFSYLMSFEILPEFELIDFSKLEIMRMVISISEENVLESLEHIAESNRPYIKKEPGSVSIRGDRLIIDFKGMLDGKPFEGGTGDNVSLILGAGDYISGFEEKLVNVITGSDLSFTVTFPDDYPVRALAGQEVDFMVHVREISGPSETTLNDDFAKSLGFESLDLLKEAVRSQISKEYDSLSRQSLKRALFDKMEEIYSFDVPPTLLQSEVTSIWKQVQHDMEEKGEKIEDGCSLEEETRSEYKRIAERRVRLGLVLSKIGELNGIKVTDNELKKALGNQIRQYPGHEEEIFQHYKNNPSALSGLQAPVFEEKVVDYLLSLVKTIDRIVERHEVLNYLEGEDFLLQPLDPQVVKKLPKRKKQ